MVEVMEQRVDPLTSYNDVVGADPEAEKAEELAPLYRVYKESKLPVSKHRGKLWKSRLEQSDSAMGADRAAWKEAIRYYRHDQTRDNTGAEGSDSGGMPAQGGSRETENIVFANVSALVPMLYTKNPDAEFTAQSEETKPLSNKLEKLMKKLASQKASPGLNLKPKVKRNIVMATLTNCGWFEVGYTIKDASSEQALIELEKLSKEFTEAKSEKDVREVEGKLFALERKIDLLSPSGPWVKVKRPWEIRIDPAASELDGHDAGWMISEEMVATAFLQAMYGEKNASGEWVSVFEPTHILKCGSSSGSDNTNLQGDNFVLFSKDGAKDAYGYGDDNSFKSAQMTKVFYVWDKATRRCELYADNYWTYPIWVWDDPYKLDQFFPFVPMSFHTDPIKLYAKGEVTYYLDHQDALNLMNNEFARIRANACSLVGYNADMMKDPSDLESIMAGTYNKRTIAFKGLPEGAKIEDVIGAVLPVSAEAIKFFDKRLTLESIDRVSGVAAVQRGVEYKTNTTNRAIESYESQQQTRADEKMDAIEESVGTVLWLVAQMCLQFMTNQDIASLTGDAEGWEAIEPRDIPLKFSPRVVGGSTLKPSSRAKKEQALQISQVVGQFAKATPVAALIALKVLETAFNNEITITDQDWAMLQQGMMQAMQGPAAGAPPQGGEGAPPASPEQGGAPQPEGGHPAPGDVIKQAIGEAAQLIDKLPPEIKQAIGVMLARQTPVQEIAQTIIGKLEQPQG